MIVASRAVLEVLIRVTVLVACSTMLKAAIIEVLPVLLIEAVTWNYVAQCFYKLRLATNLWLVGNSSLDNDL